MNQPHFYLAPQLGLTSLEFRRDFWHRKTRVRGLSYTVLNVILGLAVFVQLRLMTDGQTDRHTMTANAALAYRRTVKMCGLHQCGSECIGRPIFATIRKVWN